MPQFLTNDIPKESPGDAAVMRQVRGMPGPHRWPGGCCLGTVAGERPSTIPLFPLRSEGLDGWQGVASAMPGTQAALHGWVKLLNPGAVSCGDSYFMAWKPENCG